MEIRQIDAVKAWSGGGPAVNQRRRRVMNFGPGGEGASGVVGAERITFNGKDV